jgi:hypothetical protein
MTVTSTVPAACAGAMAVMELLELTVKELAGVLPNPIAVTLLKLLPLMVTLVSPAMDPKV